MYALQIKLEKSKLRKLLRNKEEVALRNFGFQKINIKLRAYKPVFIQLFQL